MSGFVGRNNAKISNRPSGGGDKLQGMPATTDKRASSIRAIQNRAWGENRNLIFNINQLGGVGRHRSQFLSNAGGVSGPNIENPEAAGGGNDLPNTITVDPITVSLVVINNLDTDLECHNSAGILPPAGTLPTPECCTPSCGDCILGADPSSCHDGRWTTATNLAHQGGPPLITIPSGGVHQTTMQSNIHKDQAVFIFKPSPPAGTPPVDNWNPQQGQCQLNYGFFNGQAQLVTDFLHNYSDNGYFDGVHYGGCPPCQPEAPGADLNWFFNVIGGGPTHLQSQPPTAQGNPGAAVLAAELTITFEHWP